MPHQEAHLKRWQVGAAFAAIVLIAAGGVFKVQHDSASIAQLQKTDCSLKQFLLAAREVRLQAAMHETGIKRRNDLRAARGYFDLAGRFGQGAVGKCVPVQRQTGPATTTSP